MNREYEEKHVGGHGSNPVFNRIVNAFSHDENKVDVL
jgi:hypothetical protein